MKIRLLAITFSVVSSLALLPLSIYFLVKPIKQLAILNQLDTGAMIHMTIACVFLTFWLFDSLMIYKLIFEIDN